MLLKIGMNVFFNLFSKFLALHNGIVIATKTRNDNEILTTVSNSVQQYQA